MNSNIKIGILGGDRRQETVGGMFSLRGIECALWGLSGAVDGGCVRCVSWQDAVKGANAVILPLPVTVDGVRLNCPELHGDISQSPEPRLYEIIDTVEKGTVVIGGKIPPGLKRYAAEHNTEIIDYYEHEDFQIRNAVPTAEGAIGIAMNSVKKTLADSKCGVVGYGRIGRTLARRLLSLGSEAYCIARSRRDLAWGECDGCIPKKLDGYLSEPPQLDVIFNTVPHILYTPSVLDKLKKDTVIIDLASGKGGVDTEYAERAKIKVIKALSLPGKTSPESAGKIIYTTLSEILSEVGIL